MSIIQGYVTPEEAAEKIGKSYSSVCRYVEQGKLSSIEDRGRIYISLESIEAFVEPPRGNPNFRKRRKATA